MRLWQRFSNLLYSLSRIGWALLVILRSAPERRLHTKSLVPLAKPEAAIEWTVEDIMVLQYAHRFLYIVDDFGNIGIGFTCIRSADMH